MKKLINVASYLLIVAGCSFAAWATYVIVSESFVTVESGAFSRFGPWPKIVITSPATDEVSQPIIQIAGYFPKEIKSITYIITNAAGIYRVQNNWQNNGYTTSGSGKERFESGQSTSTVNSFQLDNVTLAEGKNFVTIHIKDKTGKQYTARRFYTLNHTSTSDRISPALTPFKEIAMMAAQ
jgi:hypothetical protein